MKVRADIVRLRRWATVGVATDVQVPSFVLDNGLVVDYSRKAGHIGEGIIGADDLFDVLRIDEVLRTAFAIFAVGVDE